MEHTPVRFLTPPAAPRAVAIAVPARDEALSIGPCLAALDHAAATLPQVDVSVVVLVNNSRDATAARARACRLRAARLIVAEVQLVDADAHAGGARRAALDHAAALLPPSGVMMTTDADSCVAADWIAANLAEIEAGADAVAGSVTFDDATRADLPALPMRALEWRLAGLHARLADLLDPRPHNPWPSHIWAWGASFAITLAAYRRIGGLPAVPLAEDRALAAAVERHDLCLRRSLAPVVFTSARRLGRAPGGFADLLSSYLDDPSTWCDAALEPTIALVRRARWRARLRGLHATSGPAGAAVGARRLTAAPPPALGFGAFWDWLECSAPRLARQRLRPSELPHEVRRSERLIAWLDRRAAHRADSLSSALAA